MTLYKTLGFIVVTFSAPALTASSTDFLLGVDYSVDLGAYGGSNKAIATDGAGSLYLLGDIIGRPPPGAYVLLRIV
jgi:hypothetical protein